MKGEFSRSTFDPRKHYTSVRMQQGRVQLDADWNEQADILLHLIATQLQDLLGPGGTTVTKPGFAITLVEPPEEPAGQGQVGLPEEPTAPVRNLPDFQIGAGRYYVEGMLCENEAPVLFSRQPDYPAAASRVQEPVQHDHVLVYLDVWQRHITAAEDPAIREIALRGPDTTTRVKTVWQVKPWPLSGDPADDQGWRDRGGLRSLDDWKAFVNKAVDKGQLRAKWEKDKGAFLENHLYRVEIHAVADGQVTFKWSRENGSVVFPITPVDPSPAQEYGESTLLVTVEDLDRDPYQLQEGSWVELVDDVTVLNCCSLPLCRVKELGRQQGEVLIQADGESIERIITEIGDREPQYPLLRRWDDDTKGIASEWLDLEHGIEICFSEKGTYQVGDYWLIPARTRSEDGIEWPQEDGQPLPQAPHGIVHHYAPLALLQFGEGGWHIIADDAARFATLPQVDARLSQVDVHFDEHVDDLARLSSRVTVLEQRQADFQAPLVQYYQIADEIDIGHVVSAIPLDPSDEPDSELRVRLASSQNERDRRLIVGVVKDILGDRKSCRVVICGHAQCRVIGEVEPVDVLVPSVKPGYARKAGRLHFLQPATILGKAWGSIKFDAEVMEEIDEGKRPDQIDMSKRTGTVDMMVTLG